VVVALLDALLAQDALPMPTPLAWVEVPLVDRIRLLRQGVPASPFQLLFLGTIGLRKGVARLLEAMRRLEGDPIQLTLAGPTEIDPLAWSARPNVRWIGAVPRSRVGALYAAADALILPTLSDGFALTQLEAIAHGCPVIASRCCGEVVTPGLNGWLLPSLEPDAIAAMIHQAADQPLPDPLPPSPLGWSLTYLADRLLTARIPA